jgi:membrane protein DedA with SNARE-associated domain
MDHTTIVWTIDVIQSLLTHCGVLIVIVGVFLLGENAALAAFALSAKGFIDPVTAFICAFIGSLASDIFWFFITKYVLRKHYEKRLEKESHKRKNRLLIHLAEKHFFWTLIFIKFLIGMRLILTLYIVLKNKIPFSQKVVLDSIGTVLFMSALFPVGWYLGKGVSKVLATEQNILYALTAVVGVIIALHLIPELILYIMRRFDKGQNN